MRFLGMAGPYKRYHVPLKPSARALRRDPTPAERKLWYEFLCTLPQRFSRQKPLGNYIADFYCSSRRLVIEIDGDSHFNDAAERHDAIRTAALEKTGLRVVRFTNDEVMQDFEGVCAEVLAALKT